MPSDAEEQHKQGRNRPIGETGGKKKHVPVLIARVKGAKIRLFSTYTSQVVMYAHASHLGLHPEHEQLSLSV